MHNFGYKFPGYFMHYGPIEAFDLEEAKGKVRKSLGVSRLPRGFEVWDLAERPLVRWKVLAAS